MVYNRANVTEQNHFGIHLYTARVPKTWEYGCRLQLCKAVCIKALVRGYV